MMTQQITYGGDQLKQPIGLQQPQYQFLPTFQQGSETTTTQGQKGYNSDFFTFGSEDNGKKNQSNQQHFNNYHGYQGQGRFYS